MLPPPAAPPRPTYFHTVSLGLLVFMPSFMFGMITLSLALLYYRLPSTCWTFTVICVGISVMFMVARPVRDGPRYWFNLGCLCLLATAASNGVGFWNFYRHFSLYWSYEGQRSYMNASPSDPALLYLDAGKIAFSLDAHVEPALSYGIVDGDRFCVAPIVGKGPATTIEFWAAGVNCCGSDGKGFSCDEAFNKHARSGLVYLDYGPRSEYLKQFRTAAREAGTAHSAPPSKDAIFVAWVEDPDAAQLWFWSSGMAFLVGGSLAYMAFSLVVGLMLHFGPRAQSPMSKNKLEYRTM